MKIELIVHSSKIPREMLKGGERKSIKAQTYYKPNRTDDRCTVSKSLDECYLVMKFEKSLHGLDDIHPKMIRIHLFHCSKRLCKRTEKRELISN